MNARQVECGWDRYRGWLFRARIVSYTTMFRNVRYGYIIEYRFPSSKTWFEFLYSTQWIRPLKNSGWKTVEEAELAANKELDNIQNIVVEVSSFVKYAE